MRKLINWIAASVFAALALPGFAQSCKDLPHPRAVPDSQGCLAAVPVSDTPGERRVVVAMLHGDSNGSLESRHIEGWTRAGRTLTAPGRVVVFLVRPGYRSPLGNSSGWANPRDDDYTAENVDRVAAALRNLRKAYQADKVVVVGHSGGAIISTIILGKHPDAIDGAVLLGASCDIPPWRDHRNQQRGGGTPWLNSVNPMDHVAGVRAGTPVRFVTGDQDDNTLPRFCDRWRQEAAQRGMQVNFELFAGRNHTGVLSESQMPRWVGGIIDSLP